MNLNRAHDWSPLKSPKAISLPAESSPKEPALMRELRESRPSLNGHRATQTGEQNNVTYNREASSEAMSLIRLIVPTEVTHDTVCELGELRNVQFKDLNPDVNPFQRSFVGEIRRLDEMARRVRFIRDQIEKEADKIQIRPADESIPLVSVGQGLPQATDALEVKLRDHEQRLIQMNESYQTLSDRARELIEARHVLRETTSFFNKPQDRGQEIRASIDDSSQPLLAHDEHEFQIQQSGNTTLDLEFIAGTVDSSRLAVFERILWRVLRGNLYMNYINIPEPFKDPVTQVESRKSVFLIFVHGEYLLTKVRKVADSMGATLHGIDADAQRRTEALKEINTRLEDLQIVLYNTGTTRREELVRVAESILSWQEFVRREKVIYETLNLFNYDARRKTLIAEGWCPTRDIVAIQLALRHATPLTYLKEESGASVPPILQVLTTNQKPPTYHRTNKFTEGYQTLIDSYGIATYQEVNPGLFAVVTFPFLFAVMFGDIGHGFIVLMAALYMIYNERKFMKTKNDEVPNHIHFKRKFNIYAEFLPQLLFLQSIFGYLVICIIVKWSTDWSKATTQPPSLLNMLIYMFLSPGSVKPEEQLFRQQKLLQIVLLVLAAICVPWMLCAKPYFLWKEMKAHAAGYSRIELRDDAVLRNEEEGEVVAATGADPDDEHDFSEVIVHQVIHTIEFCLGCISNTASYLRLWALSLAHAQLSAVLWNMTIGPFLKPAGILDFVFLIAVFLLWAGATIGVLCLMEGLSAFLHALRLHWVEANGKHYEAGGYPFRPLTFDETEA
ncbi:hypothetical protein Clacol_006458 [Clathrus columnatus]|uniref:V-type proton ATPase subunit a n=1 Tax=Clathrus columnatus TaxID=1419009 RepID=A0AAV5AEQ5_9AGAM|nr:hypothetical protein Clacol_006458 [Clathrus columnatus]